MLQETKQVVLEEKVSVSLGLVRGCECRVLDIVVDEREPGFDADPNLEPHVLEYVPQGLILEVPGAVWVKDESLGAGLAAGLSSLAAALAFGIIGNVRAYEKQQAVFVAMILMLIFSEALGLYGLIVGLVISSTAESKGAHLCIPFNK